MSYKLFTKKKINQHLVKFKVINLSNQYSEHIINIIEDSHTHKYSYGKSLIIGGAEGYFGAIIIAGRAALSSGSRYIEVMSTQSHATSLAIHQPELISSYKLESIKLEKYKNILIGPGLSQNAWSENVSESFFNYIPKANNDINIILDAGMLHYLSLNNMRNDRWILTPHTGEAAKLLGISSKEIESNRQKAIIQIQEKYGGIIILKGHETLVRTDTTTYMCKHGNSSMGTAGMGDCLAGIILSLTSMAIKEDYINATLFAVGAHSFIGDVIREKLGGVGLLASNVIDETKIFMNKNRS